MNEDTINIPGPETQKLVERYKKVAATTTHDPGYQLSVVRGRGIHIWDADGNRFIDCFSQVGIASIGHNHPRVIEVLINYLNSGKVTACIPTDVYNPEHVAFLEKLAGVTKKSFPERDWRAYTCVSGMEANIAAAKLLIDRRPSRQKFLSFLGAFHGRGNPALTLSASKSVHKRYFPKDLDVTHFPYPDCRHCAYEKIPEACDELCVRIIEKEYLGRLFGPEEVNALFLEPVQGEGGIVVPSFRAIKRLGELCKKYDWALVVDEVQAGLGRTGKMFAIEHFGVVPDVICLAKALGAGLPLGAIVFPVDWDFSEAGRHSTTFGGSPLSWVAGQATLETLEKENLIENSAKMGDYFVEGLKRLQQKFNQQEKSHLVGYIGDASGLGLMIRVEFTKSLHADAPNAALKAKVLAECLRYGIAPLGAGHSKRNPTIRFLLPLIVSKDNADEILERFEKALMSAYEKLSK